MLVALALLGAAAGLLTSIAGQGGGLLLLIACSMLEGPHAALAMTAPALLCGNAHRAWLHRRSIDWPIAVRLIAGGLPGAIIGGHLASGMPASALHVILVATAAVALAKAAGVVRFTVPRAALAPAGFGVGALTGAAGGAGVLVAPILLSAGLRGRMFVATSSIVAVVTHLGRILAYGASGLFTADSSRLALSAVTLALAIAAGNVLAEGLRSRLPSILARRLEYGVLIVSVALSVASVR